MVYVEINQLSIYESNGATLIRAEARVGDRQSAPLAWGHHLRPHPWHRGYRMRYGSSERSARMALSIAFLRPIRLPPDRDNRENNREIVAGFP